MLAIDTLLLPSEKDAEIARLRRDLAHLRDELAQLHAQLGAANGHIAELTAKIGQLVESVAKANDRIGELLVIAQRKKAGPAAEKKEPAAAQAVAEDVQKAFDERTKNPEPAGALHDRPRPKQRPTGRKPLPAHLPVDESTVYPEPCWVQVRVLHQSLSALNAILAPAPHPTSGPLKLSVPPSIAIGEVACRSRDRGKMGLQTSPGTAVRICGGKQGTRFMAFKCRNHWWSGSAPRSFRHPTTRKCQHGAAPLHRGFVRDRCEDIFSQRRTPRVWCTIRVW